MLQHLNLAMLPSGMPASDAKTRCSRGGILAVSLALMICGALPGARAASRTARTDAICKQSLEARQALAMKNDPDGIYCLAVLYAARYGDERYPAAERAGYGANARIYVKRAAALGYRVDGIECDIAGGDNITNTGSYFGRRQPNSFGEHMRCQSDIGVSCAAQCGGSGGLCYSQCVGGNAWRCN
jgi:hypothetical protein